MREITILNRTSGLANSTCLDMVAAIADSLATFFLKRWGLVPILRCVTWASDRPGAWDGGEVINLMDDDAHARLLGYHTLRTDGIPEGFVFVNEEPLDEQEICMTLDHEIKEQTVNPLCRDAVVCTLPYWWGSKGGQTALFMKEICDPVQEDFYMHKGWRMGNFVTPEWFYDGPRSRPVDYDLQEKLSSPLTFTDGGYLIMTQELDRWQEFGSRRRRKHGFSRKSRIHYRQ